MPHIQEIALYRVAMPLVYPFRTAFGNDETIESLLARVSNGEQYGWGEAAPWRLPAFSAECAASAFLVCRDFLAPQLLGKEIASGEELQQRLAPIKGNYFAKAALDLAWWDLEAKRRALPLWRMVGGSSPQVKVGADFGVMESLDLLHETIARAVREGYERVKLKFRPGWELDMIASVRAAFPKLTIHVDCNSAYSRTDFPMLRRLDEFSLAMIEQPLAHDDLVDHAQLQRELTTPICLDESITSVDKTRKAIELAACRCVNIKPGRVGGITPALAIHNLCADAGLPCWIGGMLESSVGASHCVALATLPNIKYPSDIFPTERFYRDDLSQPRMALSAPSQMSASDASGVGAEPDPQRLREATLESATIKA